MGCDTAKQAWEYYSKRNFLSLENDFTIAAKKPTCM